MKWKAKFLPWLTLLAGGIGGALRLVFLGLGTDNRGLYPSSHPALTGSFILIALVMGGLIWALAGVKNSHPGKKQLPRGWVQGIGCITGALAILSAVIQTAGYGSGTLGLTTIILGILAALCLLVSGWLRFEKRQSHYLLYSTVTVYLTVQLILFYQSWNTEPQVVLYFPQLLALIFLLVSSYHHAAIDAGIGKLQSSVFFDLGAVFFCLMAAPGSNWLFFLGIGVLSFTGLCTPEQESTLPPMVLPDEVLYCISTFNDAGHSAYVVGGCVRDHLLGLQPEDFDLCTSATPEETAALFIRHKLVRNGEKHGTIGVVLAGKLYEITTFRKEGGYADTRHPDWVEFVTDITEDLARRDFTVNAMAYHPEAGLVDPFGGQQDLKARVLQAVGEPEARFREDALRILRGIRFGVRFGLQPEEKTLEAMNVCAPLLEQLAWERIYTELSKLLPLVDEAQLLTYEKPLTTILPELSGELYAAAAKRVSLTPRELPLRLAALLLDSPAADAALLRLRAPSALQERVLTLCQLASTALPQNKKLLRPLVGKHTEEVLLQLISLQRAMAAAKGEDTAPLELTALLINAIRQDGSCLTVKDLTVTGSDLLALGVEPGPEIGKCMQYLLHLVQEEILPNTKEELLEAAKAFFE